MRLLLSVSSVSTKRLYMYKHFFKRFLDFWISLIALICISPILLVVTIWLHFANKGAGAFFLQERPGKDAKIFKVIKFKTMTDDRDENGELLPDGERLTKVGRFVRSTSIDELPQLFNVLKGDMALIGPRPLLVKYLPYYTEKESLRHTVRPGVTGWAQVNGRNTVDWNKRLEYDIYYIEHLSFALDLKIIQKTIMNVLNRRDIVLDPHSVLADLDEERLCKISYEELIQSLNEVDEDFVPKLSERVELGAYANKMLEHAVFFIERDVDGTLKGVVATYVDDKNNTNGFITHVASMRKYRNQGVAKRLVNKAILHCKCVGKTGVNLCTSNPVALKLYEKMGFCVCSQSSSSEWELHLDFA